MTQELKSISISLSLSTLFSSRVEFPTCTQKRILKKKNMWLKEKAIFSRKLQ